MTRINRKYLEINSIGNLVESKKPSNNFSLKLLNPKDFQLNKFLYKQVGNKYKWVDRLIWSDHNWIKYISSNNLYTYILKNKNNLVGFFELLHHEEEEEVEIVYFGLLDEYIGKKLGGYMLTEAIKYSFKFKINRVWVHTSSLDHKNALNNYTLRGMKIFKEEFFEAIVA